MKKDKVRDLQNFAILINPALLHDPSFCTLLYKYSIAKYFIMLAIRLETAIEDRLKRLAEKTGRTKTFYAREAILQYLEDLEDYYLAAEVVEEGGRVYNAEEAERELGL